MIQENIIIWQKWADPFGESEDNNDHDMSDNEIGDFLEEEIEGNANIVNLQKPIKVISTPMGIIPINDDTASGKIFNFWLGHTNFNISSKIAVLIESMDGVEALNIFTRYRFRIAIGKAFVDSVVMNNIQIAVYEYLESYNDQ